MIVRDDWQSESGVDRGLELGEGVSSMTEVGEGRVGVSKAVVRDDSQSRSGAD